MFMFVRYGFSIGTIIGVSTFAILVQIDIVIEVNLT